MWIGRQATPTDLLAKSRQVIFIETTLEKRPRIDAWRRMALHIDHIPARFPLVTAPEVIEPDLIQGRRGRITRDMAAIFGVDPVCPHNHRHGIPAYIGLNAPFKRAISRVLWLAAGRNRVQIGRIGAVRQVGARSASKVDHLVEQEVSPLRAVFGQD